MSLRSVIFLSVSVLIQALIYFYLWHRSAARTGLGPKWRGVLGWTCVVLALSVPATMALTRLSSAAARAIAWPVFILMCVSGLMVVLYLSSDLLLIALRLVKSLLGRGQHEDPSRREFLHRAIGGGALVGAGALTGSGVPNAISTPKVAVVPITLENLPPSMDGIAIVQLTDIHVGYTIGEDFVSRMVEAANGVGADLIVITGDLVDGSVDDLRKSIAPLARLQARYGVYFVTGNHEYYSGVDAWVQHVRSLGIRVLRNERVQIGSDDANFYLAGVDDHDAHKFPGHGADYEAALGVRDQSRALVLLAHQPRQIHEAKKYEVGLQLSGHTHGGQIWPWHYLAKAQQGGLLAGHSRHGKSQLYISRGTGYWGPPVRLGAPAEITKIVLRSPQI